MGSVSATSEPESDKYGRNVMSSQCSSPTNRRTLGDPNDWRREDDLATGPTLPRSFPNDQETRSRLGSDQNLANEEGPPKPPARASWVCPWQEADALSVSYA